MISNYKIFALIFLPAALALVFGLALVQQKNKDISAAQFEDQLRNQWQLVSIIQGSAPDSEILKQVGRRLGLRVTLIDRQGSVVFDSGTQEEISEDHSQREEIRNAFLGVPTMAARRSSTTGVYTIYYADRLSPDLVLRVAYPADYYQRQAGALLAQTFSGLVALVIGVAIFALIVSRSTSQTLRELSQAVTDAKNGSLVMPAFGSEPLDGALYSLSAVTRELKE
jgi:two-component system phosphate regulon sensor histidine kinase PhoR